MVHSAARGQINEVLNEGEEQVEAASALASKARAQAGRWIDLLPASHARSPVLKESSLSFLERKSLPREQEVRLVTTALLYQITLRLLVKEKAEQAGEVKVVMVVKRSLKKILMLTGRTLTVSI